MSVGDADWSILMAKLANFEYRLEQLQEDIEEMKPKPLDPEIIKLWDRLNHSNIKTGIIPCMYDSVDPNKAMGMVCSCPKHSAYALSQGSLSDAGLPQAWKLSTTTEDYEE